MPSAPAAGSSSRSLAFLPLESMMARRRALAAATAALFLEWQPEGGVGWG